MQGFFQFLKQMAATGGKGSQGEGGLSDDELKQKAYAETRKGGGSKHSPRGWDYSKAKPMEDYATIGGLMNMTAPVHPQLRQQEQFSRPMELYNPEEQYFNNLMNMRR